MWYAQRRYEKREGVARRPVTKRSKSNNGASSRGDLDDKALTSKCTDRNLAVELQLQHLDALPGVAGFGQEDDDAKHRFDDTGAKTSSFAL